MKGSDKGTAWRGQGLIQLKRLRAPGPMADLAGSVSMPTEAKGTRLVLLRHDDNPHRPDSAR